MARVWQMMYVPMLGTWRCREQCCSYQTLDRKFDQLTSWEKKKKKMNKRQEMRSF